jgi:hypothetical protein
MSIISLASATPIIYMLFMFSLYRLSADITFYHPASSQLCTRNCSLFFIDLRTRANKLSCPHSSKGGHLQPVAHHSIGQDF